MYFNVFLYILPLPGLLDSGWLGSLGSPGLHTLNYYSIVYVLQVVYAYSAYPSLCHCHTTDEPFSATDEPYSATGDP